MADLTPEIRETAPPPLPAASVDVVISNRVINLAGERSSARASR